MVKRALIAEVDLGSQFFNATARPGSSLQGFFWDGTNHWTHETSIFTMDLGPISWAIPIKNLQCLQLSIPLGRKSGSSRDLEYGVQLTWWSSNSSEGCYGSKFFRPAVFSTIFGHKNFAIYSLKNWRKEDMVRWVMGSFFVALAETFGPSGIKRSMFF